MAADLDGSDEPVPGTERAEPGVHPGQEPTSADGAPAAEPSEEVGPDPDEPVAEPVGEPDAESVAEAEPTEPGDDSPDTPEVQAEPVPAFTKLRVLSFLAVGPLLTGYVAIAALLAVVTALASNAQFTTAGVLTAALPSWLAAYQVPVSIFGLELGILPLLPTVGVAVITAKAASRAAERLELHRPGQAGLVVGVVAGSHAVGGVLVAVLAASEDVKADALAALYYPALVSAIAAVFGVARRCGMLDALARRADVVAVAGLRAGALGVVLLLTAGGAVLTFALLTSIATARDMFPMGAGNAIGMLLLSVGYLPNAVVAATAFVAGPGFSLGTVTVSPLEFTGGRLPGVPLLAALPEQQAAWWPALFVLPLTAGVIVGRRLRDVDEDPVARLRAVAVASGVVAVCFVVLAGSAGGGGGVGPGRPPNPCRG